MKEAHPDSPFMAIFLRIVSVLFFVMATVKLGVLLYICWLVFSSYSTPVPITLDGKIYWVIAGWVVSVGASLAMGVFFWRQAGRSQETASQRSRIH